MSDRNTLKSATLFRRLLIFKYPILRALLVHGDMILKKQCMGEKNNRKIKIHSQAHAKKYRKLSRLQRKEISTYCNIKKATKAIVPVY